MGKASGCLKDD